MRSQFINYELKMTPTNPEVIFMWQRWSLWCMSLISNSGEIVSTAKIKCYIRRYLEVGEDHAEEEVQHKLEPTVLSCFLNTAACKLKLQLWQEALDSCNEVTRAAAKQRLT